jgi:hypothetical protein
MKHIILAQSTLTAQALGAWWELIVGKDIVGTELGPEHIIFDPSSFSQEGGIPAYHHLVRRLEVASADDSDTSAYDSTTILVDSINPLHLTTAQEAFTWDKLIAMLVLTFPELHWVFGVRFGKTSDTDDCFPHSEHDLASLRRPQRCWLFDPSGLRDWVRKQTGISLAPLAPGQGPTPNAQQSYLPRRRESAIAIDDETDYAFLNAYTAYRFGFRATPVSTFALASALLGQRSDSRPEQPASIDSRECGQSWPPRVIFEDIYLNFPDGKPGLSQLYSDSSVADNTSHGRSLDWPLLEDVPHRIFITSGQRIAGDDEKHERNRIYIREQVLLGKHLKVLSKPYAGMFKLWKQSGLDRFLRAEWLENSQRALRYGFATGFFFPPVNWLRIDNLHGHSTPGPLLVIAESLIRRAEKSLVSDVRCVARAVRGAVLAGDALELLGGRTGTMAVQALRLKHQFELLAECQFAGVEHHFELQPRLKEVAQQAAYIGRWFGRRERESAALNAEMQVLLDLVKVLRDYGQFDEEQAIMNRVRSIHNTLWMRERRSRLIMWPALRYVEFVLTSFSRFTFSLAAWVIMLALAFWISDLGIAGRAVASSAGTEGTRLAVSRALESFLGKGLPAEANAIRDVLYVLASSAGLLHVGAFISLLYSTLSRK